jgi:glycosyltransferase involved in cell wall biosynthesis
MVILNKEFLQDIRDKYNLPKEFILHVGVVEPRKNLSLLLKSFQNLARDGSNISLVIAGQLGWMYEDVFKQVEELGIREQVIFTGYIPPGDLPGIYNLARIFVYPSVYEGFGLPPLEAMACGTPTITTDISSMPENVGDAAILVPTGDEDALTEAMRSLLDNPDLQEQLSRGGTQRAGRFTWKANAQATLDVYKQVLETK